MSQFGAYVQFALALPSGMMRGLGFMEALDGLPAGDEHWTEIVAGLMVYRVVERAILEDRSDSYSSAFAAARGEVAAVSDIVIKQRLRDLIFAVVDNVRPVTFARLMAYGISLHDRGDLLPAVDVFRLISETSDDNEVRLQALFRTAFALRVLNRFDDAEITYQELRARAAFARNVAMRLEADLGLARIAGQRGDIPRAERMTEEVVRQARRSGINDVLANALIDLSWIAGVRRKPYEALVHGHEALVSIDGHQLHREARARVLINIATALRELGSVGVAIRTAEHVLTFVPSADQRIFATLLLYNLAIDARDSEAIERYRQELVHAHLSPMIGAEFYEALGREHAMFARFDDAEQAIRKMLAVAQEHRLNELIIRADDALADIARRRVPAIYEFRPAPVTVRAGQTVRRIETSLLDLCPT